MQPYICTATITTADNKLKNIILSLSQQEIFGLMGCCEKWDEAFKIFASIKTYNDIVALDDSSSNTTKRCICNFLIH